MAQENISPAWAGSEVGRWRRSPMRVRLEALALVGALVGILLFAGCSSTPVGELPPFELRTLSGETFSNADLKGKVTVLNFFATWCGPCKMELPELNRFARNLDPAKVALVGVSAGDEHRLDIRKFVEEYQVAFPVVLEGERLLASVRSDMLPTTVFIDAEGRVARVVQGMVSEQLLAHEVGHIAGGKKTAP